eukprot:scaffold2482_cov196-Alexandrium_tamarense.AAC.4
MELQYMQPNAEQCFLEDPEGIVHPSLHIRRETPDDQSCLLGLFAAEPIEHGAVINRFFWDRMITPCNEYDEDKFFSCKTVSSLTT